MISEVADKHQRLDGLIAAAGVQNVQPALDHTPEKIMEMMDINYKGVYCAAVSCARQMIKYDCSGSILLIASMSGIIANKGFTSSVYNSSKAAVCQLARSLAMEWGQIINGKPIRVNALCPGMLDGFFSLLASDGSNYLMHCYQETSLLQWSERTLKMIPS